MDRPPPWIRPTERAWVWPARAALAVASSVLGFLLVGGLAAFARLFHWAVVLVFALVGALLFFLIAWDSTGQEPREPRREPSREELVESERDWEDFT